MKTADQIKQAYRAALSGPNGAEMLDDLVAAYVLCANPYNDPLQAARFEGRRDLVLMMLSLLHEKPEDSIDYLVKFGHTFSARKE